MTPEQADMVIAWRLSPRELEVLRLVAAGLTDKQIGTLLGLSHHTVGDHVSSAMSKLGVGGRVRIAVLACKAGLV
jgi:DNA-binding NarL/FixJ family response regulator